MTQKELEIAQAACCVGTIWDQYEGTEKFNEMVGKRVQHLIELARNHLQQEQPKVDLVAELKHHLETTPKEQLEKEWKELERWNNIGPTVKEFLYGKQVAEESDAESDYGIDEDYIPATLFHALKKHGWYACHCKERPEIIDVRRAYVMRNWNVGKENLPQDYKPIEDSEDKKIRTRLIALVEAFSQGEYKDEMLAYLEKQKEQKPEIKYVYPIFRIGDTIKPKAYNESHRINKIKDDNYVLDNGFTFPIVDQDVWEIVEQTTEWNEEDKKFWKAILQDLANIKAVHPKVNIQDEFNWFKNLPERLKSLRPQSKAKQKPAEWSEEDKKCILSIISCLKYLETQDTERRWNGDHNAHPEQYAELITKLQSIFSRSNWKPSEEQMEALDNARFCKSYDRSELDSLYTELKKQYDRH